MFLSLSLSSALLLGGVGGLSDRTKTIAMAKVMAVGTNQTMLSVGMSSGLVTNAGVPAWPAQRPRRTESVMPLLAVTDSDAGNHSLAT
jgi:hypothetical protein